MADALNPACHVAGIRMLPVVNGKYKVWTKKIGSGNTKVLLLHGGPGFNHEYFECFEDFLPPSGFEMYYYDQLGCCNSDLADGTSDDLSLWTIPRYLEEVEEVRQGLGLESFVMLGHSCEHYFGHPSLCVGSIDHFAAPGRNSTRSNSCFE